MKTVLKKLQQDHAILEHNFSTEQLVIQWLKQGVNENRDEYSYKSVTGLISRRMAMHYKSFYVIALFCKPTTSNDQNN